MQRHAEQETMHSCHELGRTRVLINAKAGTALSLDTAQLQDMAEAHLAPCTQTLKVEIVEPERLEAMIKDAASDVDTLVIAGGDGSIGAATNALLNSKVNLGIIPLGTANLLARDLGVPLDVTEALRMLTSAKPSRIDVAEVNGQYFLCSSLIGLPPMLAEERQRFRGRGLLRRMKGYFSMLREMLRGRRGLLLKISTGAGSQMMRVQVMAVTNNLYSDEHFLSLSRPSLTNGTLGLYISRHKSIWRFFWILARAALGAWPRDPKFERQTATAVTIDVPGRAQLRITTDGELNTFTLPLEYKIHRRAMSLFTAAEERRDENVVPEFLEGDLPDQEAVKRAS